LFGVGSLAATLAMRANGNGVMNLMTTGYMLMSAGAMFFNYQRERRSWSQQMQQRTETYTKYLARMREQLQAAAAQQLVLALEDDPDPQQLSHRVTHFRGLWRRDQGTGAMRARVGFGRAPLRVNIKPPRYEPLLQPDPLGDAALALCAEVRDVARQLRVALDTFPAPNAARGVPFEILASLGLLYALALYPLDWWLVSRGMRRAWIGWLSLPAIVAGFTLLTWGIAARRSAPEGGSRFAATVTDIDAATGLVRGHTWSGIHMPGNGTLAVTLEVEPMLGNVPTDRAISWLADAGTGLGAIDASTAHPALTAADYSYGEAQDVFGESDYRSSEHYSRDPGAGADAVAPPGD
jgi:hypothetical protein